MGSIATGIKASAPGHTTYSEWNGPLILDTLDHGGHAHASDLWFSLCLSLTIIQQLKCGWGHALSYCLQLYLEP